MKQRLIFILLFIVGVVVGAKYFADFVNHQPVQKVLVTNHVSGVVILLMLCAIVLQLMGHWLRAYKSKYLLNQIRPTRVSTLFQGLSIGYLFNTLLPFRLGEIIRAIFVGDSFSISKTAVFMSIIIERTVDGFILSLSFVCAGILIYPFSGAAASTITKIGVSIFTVSLLLLLVLSIIRTEHRWFLHSIHRTSTIFNSKIRDRLRFVAWSGIYGTRLMLSDRKSLHTYLVLSLGMWMLYFSSTACVAFAFFPHLIASKIWYITQSAYVGVSAPAGPGYLGTFHLIVSGLLTEMGLHSVVTFSLYMWLIIIVPISIVGLFVLVRHRYHTAAPITHQEMLINKLYREKDISSELSHFLDAYFQNERINQLLTQAELEDKFKLIKSYKGGSNAHTMLVWQNQELRVKKITLPQYADKLQAQAAWLQERSHISHLPRVISEEHTPHYYYFDLAYNDGYLPFFEYIHSHPSTASTAVLDKVINFMRDSIYAPQKISDGRSKLEHYMDSKIIGKANDTAAINSDLAKLMGYKKIVINGKSYANLVNILEKIRVNPLAMKELADYEESVIHGDLTIDNLIISETSDFFVLDPNNENQVSTPEVDYGKLFQSLHSGYEFLIQLENCGINDNAINFEESKSQKYAELFTFLDTKLKAELKPAKYRSILFHEAVHYCRMLTYRANINPATLPVFYASAVKIFNEFSEQYDN